MADSLALVWDLIANDRASGTFARVGAEAEGASGAVGKLTAGLSALAVGGAIAASVKAAATFQSSMLLIQTQAGATSKEVADMSPKILALAGQVAQAPEALATSLYHVESTGLRGAKALDAVKVAAEGARVGHADLEQTTNALTALIASGLVPATESYAQAMGQLNTIVGSGDMKMQDLNDALSSGVLVVTKQYGVTLNDVGAALADFGDNNIRGADAATMLRMAVQSLQTPGRNAAADLAKIGLTVEQLRSDEQTGGLNKALTDLHTHLQDSGIAASEWGQLLTDAFTKKAGSGILTLIGTFDRFQQKYKEVSDGAGSFGDAWTATTKTASFQFSQLRDSVDSVGIKIGTALLPAAGNFAAWLSSVGIPAVEHFWGSVQQFAQSDGFKTFLHDVETLGVGAWHAVQQISGVLIDLGQVVLPPLVTVGGDVLHVLTELPGPVQAMAAAFVALRIAAGRGMFDGLVSGLGSVRVAFVGFASDMSGAFAQAKAVSAFIQTLDGGAANRLTGSIAGLGAAAKTAATVGLSALRSAGTGVVNMLGGPFATSVAIAGAAASAFVMSLQSIDKAAQAVTDSLKAGGPMGAAYMDLQRNQARSILDAHSVADAWHIVGAAFSDGAAQIQGYSSAADKANQQGSKAYQDWYNNLSGVAKAQQDLTLATKNYNDVAGRYGENSAQARTAAGLLRQATDDVARAQERENTAQQTHISMLHDQAQADSDAITTRLHMQQAQSALSASLETYNKDAALGSQYTGNLTSDSNDLALQMIATAKQVGDQATAQAKANGIVDDGTLATQAQLDWLGKIADQLKGPGHQAIVDYMTDLSKANVAHGDMNDAISKLGLNVVATWDANTQVISGATAQEIRDLQNLGLNVVSLPGMPGHPAQIVVTANTDAAYNALDDFTKQAAKLGFVGAIYNIAPTGPANSSSPKMIPGLPPVRKAAGGSIVGPGTGTSDSVLIAASNGEHMWTAKEVAAAGGHGAVESLRKAVLAHGGGRANGGAIYPVDWDQAHKSGWSASLSKAQADAAAAAATFSGGGGGAGSPLIRALGQNIANAMGFGGQFSAIDYIFSHESGWNPNAQNPTSSAYGIPQFLNSTWAQYGGKTSDPSMQIKDGIRYMVNRYGSPNGAAAFWQGHHWYDNGGYLMPGLTMAYNGTGKPERIRTAEQEAALGQGGAATFHLYDADGVLMGTMRGHAEDVVVGALSSATTRARNSR